MGRLILALLLLTASCAQGTTQPVRLILPPDDSAPTGYVLRIRQSMQAWRDVCGEDVQEVPEGTPGARHVVYVNDLPWGKYGETTSTEIRLRLAEVDYIPLVSHEIGHAMGRHHTDTGIMRASVDFGDEVEPGDCALR